MKERSCADIGVEYFKIYRNLNKEISQTLQRLYKIENASENKLEGKSKKIEIELACLNYFVVDLQMMKYESISCYNDIYESFRDEVKKYVKIEEYLRMDKILDAYDAYTEYIDKHQILDMGKFTSYMPKRILGDIGNDERYTTFFADYFKKKSRSIEKSIEGIL